MSRRLTPDRFRSLWTASGDDDLPFPLRYRSAARWEDEHIADLRAAERWRQQLGDPVLERALHILRAGEIAIEIYANSSRPGESLFVAGAVAGEDAVLARQHVNAGDIEVTTMPIGRLPGSIAALLPAVPPGRIPEHTAPTRSLLDLPVNTAVRLPLGGGAAPAVRDVLLRPRTATGSIRFLLRSPGTGPTGAGDVGWFDVADDGRYLFVQGADTRVAPGTTEALHTELSSRLDVARAAPRTQFRRPLQPY